MAGMFGPKYITLHSMTPSVVCTARYANPHQHRLSSAQLPLPHFQDVKDLVDDVVELNDETAKLADLGGDLDGIRSSMCDLEEQVEQAISRIDSTENDVSYLENVMDDHKSDVWEEVESIREFIAASETEPAAVHSSRQGKDLDSVVLVGGDAFEDSGEVADHEDSSQGDGSDDSDWEDAGGFAASGFAASGPCSPWPRAVGDGVKPSKVTRAAISRASEWLTTALDAPYDVPNAKSLASAITNDAVGIVNGAASAVPAIGVSAAKAVECVDAKAVTCLPPPKFCCARCNADLAAGDDGNVKWPNALIGVASGNRPAYLLKKMVNVSYGPGKHVKFLQEQLVTVLWFVRGLVPLPVLVVA